MAYIENHVLYYRKSCPFCQKVLHFMNKYNINLDKRETTEPGNQDDLIRIGGKKQVPCLVIDGRAMYESDDICDYLRQFAE